LNNEQPITKEYFIKRFLQLCLRSGLTEFPKDERDQHILLKSALITMGKPGNYSEKEINDRLEYWVSHLCQIKNIDRVTIRRSLVDAGYLTRNKDGSSYQIPASGAHLGQFDEAIDQLDLLEVLTTAREEIDRRKKEYLEKTREQSKKPNA
jgi:hypothetical protein